MVSQQRTWTGAEPVGGRPPVPARKVNQAVAILQKDFTSAQQAVPIRVVFGRALVAGAQITPIFGFRAVEVESEFEGGK